MEQIKSSLFRIMVMAAYTQCLNARPPNPSRSMTLALPDATSNAQVTSPSPRDVNIITSIVFGIVASIIGVITIWQAHKIWLLTHRHHRRLGEEAAADDLELRPRIDNSDALQDSLVPTNTTESKYRFSQPMDLGSASVIMLNQTQAAPEVKYGRENAPRLAEEARQVSCLQMPW